MYYSYTYHIPSRYEEMEDIKNKIIENGGEKNNKFLAFFYYFNGWLRCADGKLHPECYQLGLDNLFKANEICLEISEGEENYYLA
jgi:hypothetical protein